MGNGGMFIGCEARWVGSWVGGDRKSGKGRK